ncbi:hypothetical protein EPUS_08884 [Endocarpon pusillum Z07020]|uniref:Uncharacterized protein n=1 Tax=Endocarpon pusillum (strain Z07020 / HMAS-L-300199) TaxID=1263415 RepID=U1HU69_ENDPU|nr:uncharacterized protein EPUS_08884 [Endocarpon pusillum Z07020]ERF74145.1 hypothetical protein EPUS_08884 [Endocarpon pusillum Z07020]
MEIDNAFAKVFQAFMAIPNAKSQFSLDKPIPPGVLLKYPTVAKVIFSNEPGCAVNYRAIVEKIKVLEPHFKVTSCGPPLMEYFAVLRKKRNKWAVAFANYQSHMILTFLVEQKLYGCPLNASQRAAFPDGPRAVLSESLAAAWQELSDIKKSREFVQNVRILEECVKQHKIYLQRKAAAQKQRQALVKKKQAEARKAKKAALASSAVSHQQRPSAVQSTFNPDLPDFAQFISSFTSPTPPPVAASSNKKPQKVTTNISQATKTANSINATVENKSAKRNGARAAAAEAQPITMAATSTNMTTQPPANSMAQTSLGVIAPTSANSAAPNNMMMMGPTPAVRIDKPTSTRITRLTRNPGTTEEWMMEEPLFPYFVSIYGYPPPNCFVGPLPGSHGEHKVYIEHQPKYSPEELEKYKQMGTKPPPARYVTLHEKKVTHQTPVTSQMPNTTHSNAIINMNDPTACTVTAINHDGSDKEVEPPGLGHASSTSNAASAPEEVTEQSSTEPGINNEADVELEKAIRAEIGSANPDSAASTNSLPSTMPGSIEQAQATVEQNTSTALEVSQDVASNETGASLSACPPASNSPTLTSSNSTERTLAEADPSGFMSFEEFTERFNNGEFQDELPAYDPTLDITFDATLNPTLDHTLNPTIDPTFNPTLNPTLGPTFDPTLNSTLEPCKQSQDLGMDMGWQGWDGEIALPPLGSTPDVDGFEENQYFNELFGRGAYDN